MVMVAAPATAEQLFTTRQAGYIDLAGVEEQLQGAVHGGEAHPGTALLQQRVQLLRRTEVRDVVQ
jgi:hypothetical protein